MSPRKTRRKVRKSRERREGMVLLIVLMIITVASATAAYAMQGAAVDVQAAGAYKRRAIARYSVEALVMAGATLIDEVAFCQPGVGGATPDMARYGLAALNTSTSPTPSTTLTGGVSMENFGTTNTLVAPVASDCDLRQPVLAAGTDCLTNPDLQAVPHEIYFPFAAGVAERWGRGSVPEGSPAPYRCAITFFGEYNIAVPPLPGLTGVNLDDGAQDDGVGRRYHDTITMTQAYYDFTR